MSEVTYTSTIGGADDGNSLQLYNGGWIANTPTPGTDATGTTSGGGGGSSSGGTTTVSTPTKPVFLDTKKDPVWSASIALSVPSLFTNTPFIITPKVINPKGSTIATGRFVYTLGDGRVFERKNNDPVDVEYSDPGAYTLYFDFYENIRDKKPTVTEHLLVSVEDPPILINLDTQTGYKITLSNLHPKEVDISSWTLSDGYSTFTFPLHTFIPGKSEVTLSPVVHTFSGNRLQLSTPTGHIVATYPSSVRMVAKSALGTLPTNQPNTTLSPGTVTLPPAIFESTTPLTSPTFDPQDTTTIAANAFGARQTLFHNEWTLLFIILLVLTCIALYIFFQPAKNDPELSPTTPEDTTTQAQAYTITEVE